MSARPQKPEPRIPLPRGINPSYYLPMNRGRYVEARESGFPKSNAGTVGAEVKVYVSGSYRKFQQLHSLPDVDVVVSLRRPTDEQAVKESFRLVVDRLSEKHPGISTNPKVLGGTPHIEGLRISVPHVLAHLHHLESIDAIIDEFKQRISREQIKQALAYAHDFMEMACDPSEDDD